MNPKPYSQACENNKRPILAVLRRHWAHPGRVLEIGSGTGQHAVFFAGQLPHLQWQSSDLAENHAAIRAWMADHPAANLLPPLTLDVTTGPWPDAPVDGVFSANTLHIMSWPQVLDLLQGVSGCLKSSAQLIVYGPFNYQGQFTSASNAAFNQQLQAGVAHRAIRDFEAVCAAAEARGLEFIEDNPMPANNRCLVFQRS